MMTAMGNHKHAVLLPLEAFLAAVGIVPDGSESPAIDHVNDLVEGKLERFGAFSGGNLGDACRTHAFLSHELDKRALTLALLPPVDRHMSQVLDKESRVDR